MIRRAVVFAASLASCSWALRRDARGWAIEAALEADPAKAYEAAMHGIDELGTAYRGAKGSHHVIDETGQHVRMAKLAADKGDHAGAATELTKVLHQRIEIYLRTFPGSVE